MDQLAFNFDDKMTSEERHILNLLRKGRPMAIPVRDLAVVAEISEVGVRQTVRSLIMNHGILIASSVSDPPGYFLAETADEIIEATRSLRHRGIMILIRAAKLQKCSIEMVFGQARLELESDK